MKLTAVKVSRVTSPGMYSDGHGLYLQVQHGGSRSWIFRYKRANRGHFMGLGSAAVVTLARARELAMEQRRLLAEGRDPLEARRAQRQTINKAIVTFRQAAESYLAAHEHSWKSTVHRLQWRTTLETVVYPTIGGTDVAAVDTAAVLTVLQPIWSRTPETADRIRGRIESILSAAKAAGLRSGENPALWRGHLETLLPAPSKLRPTVHHKALAYRDVPAFVAELRSRNSMSAAALLFTILTGGRRSEVLGATWGEVNFVERVWTIPGSRMKAGKEHRVPLSDAAVEILRPLYEVRSGPFVFPGKPGRPLSEAAMQGLLRIMGRNLTTHGFRSSFRDWSAEQTSFASEVCEAALAHVVGNQTERAYKRTDLFDRRRRLMDEWARFCEQAPTTAEVVAIRG
jgi:integrase